jgi:hypothetical protein
MDPLDYKRLSAPRTGNPWGLGFGDVVLLPTTASHYYCSQRILGLAGDTSAPLIAEIGGGFGGMAYFLLKDRSDLVWIDFDLPEVLLVASYYLMCAFPERKFLLYGETDDYSVASLKRFDAVFLPNFMLPCLDDNSVDVFSNTRSFSEMDRPTIDENLKHVIRSTRQYFYHENSDRALPKGRSGFTEIEAFTFPIPREMMRMLHKGMSPWGGGGGRYKEFLYQKTGKHSR